MKKLKKKENSYLGTQFLFKVFLYKDKRLLNLVYLSK